MVPKKGMASISGRDALFLTGRRALATLDFSAPRHGMLLIEAAKKLAKVWLPQVKAVGI